MKHKLRLPIGFLLSISAVLTVISQLPTISHLVVRGTSLSNWFSLSNRFTATWSGGGCDDMLGLCTEPFMSVARVISMTDILVWFVLCLLVSLVILDVVTTLRLGKKISKKSIYGIFNKYYSENSIFLPIIVAIALALFYSIVTILFTIIPLMISELSVNSSIFQWLPDVIYKNECYQSYGDNLASCVLQVVSISDIISWFVIWSILLAVIVSIYLIIIRNPIKDKA